MLTSKQPVINAVLITYTDYSITVNYIGKMASFLPYTSGASPQSSESHLLTFLVAQLRFLREGKLSDRRLYEIFGRRLLIWGNPKERNSPDYYPLKKHAFFLRRPVLRICEITFFLRQGCMWSKLYSTYKLVDIRFIERIVNSILFLFPDTSYKGSWSSHATSQTQGNLSARQEYVIWQAVGTKELLFWTVVTELKSPNFKCFST